jgi:hypothetical protein
MHYKNSDKSIAVIAEKTTVAHLLEGSGRCDKRRRVAVTLIRAAARVNLRSESYDRDLAADADFCTEWRPARLHPPPISLRISLCFFSPEGSRFGTPL